MTAPAAIDLSYAAAPLQAADLSVFFQITYGFHEAPRVRGTDTVVPRLAGRVEGIRVADLLPILLTGHITYDPSLSGSAAYADFWVNVRTYRTLFDPARTRADLVATLVDGSIWTVSARPMNILKITEIPNEYVEWSVELEGSGDWVESS
jgi:hypothetical protein